MKRPLIALSLTLFFTLFVVVIVRGREPLSTDTPLQVSLVDPTSTSTSTPTATVTTEPTASPTPPATPTITLVGNPPRLVQFQPANGTITSRLQPITLTFSQNMDQASVAAALTVSPTVPFTLTWTTAKTVIINPTAPWPAGTDLSLNLEPTAHNEAGQLVAAAIHKPFHTGSIVTLAYVARTGQGVAPVKINFGYDMDQTSVAAAIQFDPPINGTLSWQNNRTATFTPDDWLAQTEYTLSFTTVLTDASGDTLALPPATTFVPPFLLEHSPGNNATNVSPATPLVFNFDRPIDPTSVQAAIIMTPTTAGNFTLEGNSLTFVPSEGYLNPSTTYRVKLATTALSVEGKPLLLTPYRFSFTTGQLESEVNFGWGTHVQVVDSEGRRAIQFQTSLHSGDLTLELATLSQSQFMAFYPQALYENLYGDPLLLETDLPVTYHWDMTLDAAQLNQYDNIGELLIPADIPPGLYLLTVRRGYEHDQILVALSQNALVVKKGMRQMTAWVMDTHDQPIAEAEVQIFDEEGNVLVSGRTNALGIFKTSLDPASPAPYLIMARQGTDIVITGLDYDWYNYSSVSYGNSTSPFGDSTLPYASTIYTDRPIYRPGHTVYYKAIIRRDNDAILDMIPAGTAVQVRVADSRNNTIREETLLTNSFGTINSSFTLAEGAMLGQYRLVISLGEYSKSQNFKVEDYRKPEYEVTLTTDSPVYTNGDTVTIQVATNYYFGEPVASAAVTLNFYEPYTYYDYYGESGYVPQNTSWETSWNHDPIQQTTNADGTTSFTWTASFDDNDSSTSWGSNLRSKAFGLEVTVDDGNGQPVSSLVVIRVYNRQERIRVPQYRFLYAPGETFSVEAIVETIDGEPVRGRTLTAEVTRYNRTSRGYDTIATVSGTTTNENGLTTLNLTLAEPGYYYLTLRGQDASGKAITVRRWIYIYRPGVSNWAENYNAIAIQANAEQYAPGDTAQLTIESGFAGPALLTFERATTRREMMIELTPPLTIVEVPIRADDVPNIFVTVNAWRPQDTQLVEEMVESKPDSHLLQASVNLSVPATAKTLNVTITPDRTTTAPGEELSLTIHVTNQQGVPISAELSLAMVDEAIFALSADLSGPLYDAFYFQRRKAISTYNSYEPTRYLWDGGGMGGGGGGGDGTGSPRSDFRDTAYWFPALYTDANGEVTVTITLPDNLTSWRFTARAVTADTQVGETLINVITRQDVMVRPQLPRSLTTGDTLTLSALVQNFSDQPQTLTVGVMVPRPLPEAGTPITFTGTITQIITLAPDETRIVGWQAVATGIGTAELIFYAQNEAGPGDAIMLMIPVRPLAIPNVTSAIGQFSTSNTSLLLWPENALPNSTVRIELSRSIAGSMVNGLEYLTGYPYGCVEQTMSRALPTAVVARAFNQLGIGTPALQADLTAKLEASIQRLYGFQHDDGGWGWWHDDDSHDYQTAWVIFGLTTMADAGYTIDPAVISRGAEWLNDNLATMDVQTRAYALYSLALAGQGNLPQTLSLVNQVESLDPFSQAGLALALWQLGETAEAQTIVDLLTDSAVINGNMVHWQGTTGDGYYDHKTMASDTRSTALVLSALVHIEPGHSLEAGTVRWLMAQRRATGWGTTNETSYAILGLTDHLLAVQAAGNSNPTTYTVELDGVVVEQGVLAAAALGTTLELPANLFQPGENVLRLSHTGPGLIYYTIVQRTYTAQPAISAAGSVTVSRRYLDPQSNLPVGILQVGDLVKVELRYTLDDTAFYLMVEDQLPGGLEALNERLNTTSHEAMVYGQQRSSYWREYGYNYKEVRGDRVTFFITEAGRGVHTITYLARVTQSGTFNALPAELSAMYDASTWGRSASDELLFRPYNEE